LHQVKVFDLALRSSLCHCRDLGTQHFNGKTELNAYKTL